MRLEHSIKLARASRSNGHNSKRESAAALRAAQAAQVSNLDYLRAHILLDVAHDEIQIAPRWWLQDTEAMM
ncbi:MAG: hypothetical protein ACREDR_24335 [Blastocatellia bacterium]